MHLVNSMKLVSYPAGVRWFPPCSPSNVLVFSHALFASSQQYITHKGADADSFFVILRGEAQECVKLTLNENSEMRQVAYFSHAAPRGP